MSAYVSMSEVRVMGVLLAVCHDVEEGLERRHGHVGAAVRDVHLRHLLVRDAVSALSYS